MNRKWTDEQIEHCKALLTGGATYREAAADMDKTYHAVKAFARVHGMVEPKEWSGTPRAFGLKPDAKPFDPSYADLNARERLDWGNDRYVRALLKEGVARGLIRVTPSDRVAA